MWDYYRIAPTHLEECRRNSYGCEEAAEYLARIQDIEDCRIVSDFRMTVFAYLKYSYHIQQVFEQPPEEHLMVTVGMPPQNNIGNKKMITYYVVWAPESHPEENWDGTFSRLYTKFRQRYPKEIPIKTIYYPDGLAALYIFKVLE